MSSWARPGMRPRVKGGDHEAVVAPNRQLRCRHCAHHQTLRRTTPRSSQIRGCDAGAPDGQHALRFQTKTPAYQTGTRSSLRLIAADLLAPSGLGMFGLCRRCELQEVIRQRSWFSVGGDPGVGARLGCGTAQPGGPARSIEQAVAKGSTVKPHQRRSAGGWHPLAPLWLLAWPALPVNCSVWPSTTDQQPVAFTSSRRGLELSGNPRRLLERRLCVRRGGRSTLRGG